MSAVLFITHSQGGVFVSKLKERSVFVNIAVGLLYAVLGAVIMLIPAITTVVLFRILGVFILIHGIFKLTAYFMRDPYSLLHRFDLALGVFYATTGIIFIMNPRQTVTWLAFLVGVFILLGGLVTLQTSYDGFRYGLRYWYLSFISALVTVLFALFLMFAPTKSASFVTSLIGIALILSGIEKIIIAIVSLINRRKGNDPQEPIEVDFTDVK